MAEKTKKNNKQYRVRWGIWIPVILLAPILINLLVYWENPTRGILPNAVGTGSDWLIFWGSYAGAVITGLVTLYVLFRTLNQNQHNHKELYELQIKDRAYNHRIRQFEELKAFVYKNLSLFELANMGILIHGDPNTQPENLELINKQIEEINRQGKIIIIELSQNTSEQQVYNAVYRKLANEYQSLLLRYVYVYSLNEYKNKPSTDFEALKFGVVAQDPEDRWSDKEIEILASCEDTRELIDKLVTIAYYRTASYMEFRLIEYEKLLEASKRLIKSEQEAIEEEFSLKRT